MSQRLIVDPGTGFIKAGFHTDSLPSLVFPSVVGQIQKKRTILKKKTEATDDASTKSHYVGEEALMNLGKVSLSSPLEHGIVKKWDEMEHICNKIFQDLGCEAEKTGIILTHPLYNPKDCTERLAATFFESFLCPSLALVPQANCALYASGRTTGLVLDSGEGITQVTPIFDSYPQMRAANRINFGGREVTEHLQRLLYERGYNFSNLADEIMVQKMKETNCYVSQEYEKDMLAKETDEDMDEVELPDGQTVKIAKERFRAPEILFNPNILHSELPSFPDFVAESVKACGIDIRKALLANMVLSGGNTMFKGFASRLQDDVTRSFPGLFGSIHAIDSPDRKFSVWAGASVVASLASFSSHVITRDVYEEHGPSIIHHYDKGKAGVDDEADAPKGENIGKPQKIALPGWDAPAENEPAPPPPDDDDEDAPPPPPPDD